MHADISRDNDELPAVPDQGPFGARPAVRFAGSHTFCNTFAFDKPVSGGPAASDEHFGGRYG